MRLAISAGELDDGEPLEAIIELAVGCGVSGVELWYPKNFSYSMTRMASLLADAGLEVAAVSSATELGRGSDVTPDAATLKDALLAAKALSAPNVNTYFGYRSKRDDERSSLIYAERLSDLLASSPVTSVNVLIENESDGFGNDPSASDPTRRPGGVAALMAAAAEPRFGLTLDPTNAYIAGNDPLIFARTTARHTKYVHAKNALQIAGPDIDTQGWRSFQDQGRHYQTCPFDAGAVPWRPILRDLANRGYDGWVTIEPHCARNSVESAFCEASAALRDIISSLPPRF
ncbi:sugar phosphate isomerase/epimerase [Aestuariivita sp.]|jgi:sugar phosphate isomerase/epimerase|uniref:sugar phosphate isomerase/epimerase family protein n=1 Tax=Aestuariivita sp. TaxID=1872407 RepID=UPI0021741130|nr:sugar phosphate isomerase/epimerase [Aestuariivita sp.]MCE8008108.1 sugar phosphate isomerase/epimerase [Aestuariivita sp.]